MFIFNESVHPVLVILVWLTVLGTLVLLNELTRKYKYVGFFAFFILPLMLTALWFTVLRETLYVGWFHMVKVYTATLTCIGFWCIRYLRGTSKTTGQEWKLSATKFAIAFPPLILAINMLQAVVRDFQLGFAYSGMPPTFDEGAGAYVIGGAWNFMNGVAGIIGIIVITGFVGIGVRKVTDKDRSRSILWPDMLWFYIIAYSIWNFAYVYNAIPHRSWYNGLALLIAPIIVAFTTGKGSWIQHRGHTLALWVYFALTFPMFLDESVWRVNSTYNPTVQFWVSFVSLAANAAVLVYMLYKTIKHKRKPYQGEVYTDLKSYQEIKGMMETKDK